MSNPALSKSGFVVYRRLLLAAAPYWILFALGILGTVGNSGIDATLAWSIKPIINNAFIARDRHFIHWLPLFIIVFFLLRGLTGFLSDFCITRVGRNVVMDFRQKIFAHLLRLPAYFFDKNSSGQLLSALIYNVEQVADAATDALVMVVQEGSLAIFLLVSMVMISWQLTLLFIATAPAMAVIFRVSSKMMRRQSTKSQETMADITHVAEESIEGYKVIRTFGGEAYEMAKFNHATRMNRMREMKIIAIDSLGTSAVQLVASLVMAATIYLAASSVLHLSAGSFASMMLATFMLLRPLKRLTTINNRIQKGIAGAQSIFILLDREPEKDTGTVQLQRAKGYIEYREVTFNYPEIEKKVLENISFNVKSGESVALVGKSGSGKSTLVSLLPRFYDVHQGKILIDAIDIGDYRLADLRSQFAFVSQHVTLFNDTVAHNIAYGKFSNVSEAEIIRVAEAAHAMEFIRHLPKGIHTLIGENGVLLSGGQRQRIAIARAILKNAPILILDEATSALDTESERHIQAALEQLMRNRTSLVIAHRLSTIENADRIIVLDHGCIVEMGTHKQLLQLKGYYAKLHAMQFREEEKSVEDVAV